MVPAIRVPNEPVASSAARSCGVSRGFERLLSRFLSLLEQPRPQREVAATVTLTCQVAMPMASAAIFGQARRGSYRWPLVMNFQAMPVSVAEQFKYIVPQKA